MACCQPIPGLVATEVRLATHFIKEETPALYSSNNSQRVIAPEIE